MSFACTGDERWPCRERLRVRGAELLGGRLNNTDIASHVALQVRHVEFRGHFIPVPAMLDVAALDQLVQPLRDNVARAADHTADLGPLPAGSPIERSEHVPR